MENRKTVFPVFRKSGRENRKTKEQINFSTFPANYTETGKPVFLGVQENGFPEVFQRLFRAVIPRIVVAREAFAAGLAVEELLRHLAGFRRLDGTLTNELREFNLKTAVGSASFKHRGTETQRNVPSRFHMTTYDISSREFQFHQMGKIKFADLPSYLHNPLCLCVSVFRYRCAGEIQLNLGL